MVLFLKLIAVVMMFACSVAEPRAAFFWGIAAGFVVCPIMDSLSFRSK